MRKRDSPYIVRAGTVPEIQQNAPRLLNGTIPIGTPYKHTAKSAEPPSGLINFVDVNTVPQPSNQVTRANNGTQNAVQKICTECILQETKISGLKVRNDQVRKEFNALEEENRMLRLHLNMYTSTPDEPSDDDSVIEMTDDNTPIEIADDIDDIDDIRMECNENCKICMKTLTQQELNTHICIDLHEVKCEYCSHSFESINGLWNHITNSADHNDIKSYRCSTCMKIFPAAVFLMCHRNVEHKKTPELSKKLYQCGLCGESFNQPKELTQHVNAHNIERRVLQLEYQPLAYNPTTKHCFECYVCKLQMNRLTEVRNHIKLHGSNKLRRTICKICSKHIESDGAKQSHICDKLKQSNLKCEYCVSSYRAVGQLLEHLEYAHPGRTMHKCRKCPKYFAMKQLVDIHEEYHEGVEKAFGCDQCWHRFADQRRLDRHMKTHSVEKCFTCEECGKSFRFEYNLKKHSYVHSNEMIQCPDCPAKFKSQLRLKKHREVHEKLKYKCNQCSSTFTSKISLHKHTKRVHEKKLVKNFHCTLCSYKFSERKGLRNHMRVHTKEKSFECEFCDRKYAHKGDLTKHLQIHVGNNIYTCEQCGMGFRLHLELRNHTYEHYKQDKEKSSEQNKASTSNAI